MARYLMMFGGGILLTGPLGLISTDGPMFWTQFAIVVLGIACLIIGVALLIAARTNSGEQQDG